MHAFSLPIDRVVIRYWRTEHVFELGTENKTLLRHFVNKMVKEVLILRKILQWVIMCLIIDQAIFTLLDVEITAAQFIVDGELISAVHAAPEVMREEN